MIPLRTRCRASCTARSAMPTTANTMFTPAKSRNRLAQAWLMRAMVAGTSLRELVFRTIYSHANAEIQLRSMALGKIGPLSRGEAERTGPYQLQPRPMARAWEYWTTRLEKSGEMPEEHGL